MNDKKVKPIWIVFIAVVMIATAAFVIVIYDKIGDSTDRESVLTTSVVTDAYGRTDINVATLEQIAGVDGIGYKLASDIVDYRSAVGVIHDMNELSEIRGIGEKKLEALCQKFYVLSENTITSTTTTCVTKQAVPSSTYDSPSVTSTVSATAATTNVNLTTKSTTKSIKHTTTTQTSTIKRRRVVNINTATASQISDCLMIDFGLAEEIVSCRSRLGGCYTNKYEVLYCDGMSDSLFIDIRDYIII